MWSFSTGLLSGGLAEEYKDNFSRFLATKWLLTLTVLLPIFSGEFYNFLIRARPHDLLEDIDGLTTEHWKDSKVYSLYLVGIFDQLVDARFKGTDPKLAQLSDRTEWLDTFSMVLSDKPFKKLFAEIISENSVFLTNGLFAYYLIQRLRRHSPEFAYYEQGVHYHIANLANSKTFFINIHQDYFTEFQLQQLNKM